LLLEFPTGCYLQAITFLLDPITSFLGSGARYRDLQEKNMENNVRLEKTQCGISLEESGIYDGF
jgi:hypothetical protein